MRTLNCENEELKSIIEVLKKEEYIILSTDVDCKDKFIMPTSKTRHKLSTVIIELYTPSTGDISITVENYKDIPNYLKEFFETSKFVVYNVYYNLSVMLNLDIILNIEINMKLIMDNIFKGNYVGFNSFKKHLKNVRPNLYESLEYKCITHQLYGLFDNYKLDCLKHKSLIQTKVSKLIARGNYFNLFNDLDKRCVDERISLCKEQLEATTGDNLSDEYKCATGIHLYHLLEEAKQNNMLISNSAEYRKYRILHELVSDLHNLRNINDESFSTITSYSDNTIRQHMHPSIKSSFNKRAIFRTNTKKYYYLEIDAMWLLNNYLEKLNGLEQHINGDYHKLVATKLFDKQESDITLKERRKAKVYNFFRMIVSNNKMPLSMKSAYMSQIYEHLTREEIQAFMRKVPIFYDTNKEVIDLFLVTRLAKLYDLISEYNLQDINLVYVDKPELIFRVSNKINPIEIVDKIIKIMDTTKLVGYNAYNTFNISNAFKNLFNMEGALTLDFIEYLKNNDEVTKFSNIERDVYSCYKDYLDIKNK